MKITYTTRRGLPMFQNGSRAELEARLRVLDMREELTKKCAPTDSGDVRFNEAAEAKAIRRALA